jgi:Domain of unknown function (DUF4153)
MKFSNFFSREQFMMSIREILSRFFQAAILSLVLTIYLIYKIISDSSNQAGQDDIILRTVTSLILTFFLSLGVALFYESSDKKFLDRDFPILPIVYGLVFYFTVKFGQNYSLQGFTYFLLHLTGFIAFAFFLPYLRKLFLLSEKDRVSQNTEYSNYFSRVSWTFLMSGIVGLSLVLLGVIAIASVVSLFELESLIDEEKYYGTWITLSLAFIAPMYGLREFPEIREIEKMKFEVNRFFSFLIRYLATPAVYIYFIILYAYSAKVLLNFSDWPKGIISWLVIGFSSFGYLTYIFSKPYEENKLVVVFRKWFPLIVIPQLGMLFYAIGLRIGQYDLTMNRYFVVAFGFWLLVTSLYFLLRRTALLAFVPASLALVSFVISIGPWGVFSYPFSRQESRLIRNLETAKILQNGKIVPLSSERDISKELSTDIASGIEYLCQFDSCKRVKELFPDQVSVIEKRSREDWERWNKENTWAVYPWVYSSEIESNITQELKVTKYYYDDIKHEFPEQEYLYYSVASLIWGQFPLSVGGYDTIIQVLSESDTKYQDTSRIRYPYMSIDPNTSQAYYFTASGVSTVFSLKISDKLLDSSTLTNVTTQDLTFDLENETQKIRLVLQSLTIKNPRYTPSSTTTETLAPYTSWGYGLALVKNKK